MDTPTPRYEAVPPPGRVCGPCNLCCRLLPVAEFGKGRNVWCQHARPRQGCAIYADRPRSCRSWSCMWMLQEIAEELRPDRSHIVIDMVPDVIGVTTQEGKDEMHEVLVMWGDPNYPGAHRAPGIRELIQLVADEYRMATMIRIGNRGVVVFAPSLSSDEQWHETESNLSDKWDSSAKAQAERVAAVRNQRGEAAWQLAPEPKESTP